jgi:diguanylate cyclase (GGDEF)-like protein
MASFDFPTEGAAPFQPEPVGETRDAHFEAALLRAQYRSLARLSPYVHGVVILATVALCGAARQRSTFLGGFILPAALVVVSLIRLIFWLKARDRVECETLDVIRREVRAAGVLGPALAIAVSLMAADSTSQGGVPELPLALGAVWVAIAACAFCVNALASKASVAIVASTAPLIVTFLNGGADITIWLAALLAIASCLVIRMLSEAFGMFAEVVRSRFAIAEKQRVAEDARRAAMTIALTDYLTGLPNRRCFQRLLADRIQTGLESATPFAVGLIDLDGFKPINDSHGHPVGDEVLRQVADRLAKAMDGRGCAVRMGGDEFAILCDGVGARDETIALGGEIQALFATPFVVEALDISLSGACGFALFPSSAAEPDELVRLADAALYRAKTLGRGGVAVFDAKAESDASGRATLEEAVRRAVAASRIGVAFQPMVDLATGRISGFETLAFWDDNALGAIAPSVFIPVAERIGVIDQLSRDLLRMAVSAAAQWPSGLSLSFNLSAAQLSTPTTGIRILSALKEFGFPPTRFEVEVSEAAIMKNLDAARATIEALRKARVRVTLDDFGAGASSLAQLRELAIDKIKIERSFIDEICREPKIAVLTRAIIDMCRRLDLPCVADGIERQEQLDELRLSGCAGGQGALFASAMPDAMVAEFLKDRLSQAA